MSFFTPFAFVQSAAAVSTFDANAQAYINAVIAAGGTLSSGNQNAINDLYVSLKANSLYTELKYMYPFMGGTPASHAVCGINPTSGSYTITWGAGLTGSAPHTSAGVNTLTFKGYGSLAVNTATIHSSVNSVTLGTYVSTATTNDLGFVIGKTSDSTNATQRYQMNVPFDSNIVYTGIGLANFATYNNTVAPVGRWIGSRTSSTSLTLYKNGSSVATNTVNNTGALSGIPPQFFSIDNSLTASNLFDGVCGFMFAGNGLSGAQVSTLDGILSTFLTAIGR